MIIPVFVQAKIPEMALLLRMCFPEVFFFTPTTLVSVNVVAYFQDRCSYIILNMLCCVVNERASQEPDGGKFTVLLYLCF